MPASNSDLRRWVEARNSDDTHMIVKCDSFDFRGGVGDSCCYPIYVGKEQDVIEVDESNNDRTMEVYSFTDKNDIEAQLNHPGRVFNFD